MSAIIVTKRGKKYVTSDKFEAITEVKKSFHETDFKQFDNKDKKNPLFEHREKLEMGFHLAVMKLYKEGVEEVSAFINSLSDKQCEDIAGTIIPERIWSKTEEQRFRNTHNDEPWTIPLVDDKSTETEENQEVVND